MPIISVGYTSLDTNEKKTAHTAARHIHTIRYIEMNVRPQLISRWGGKKNRCILNALIYWDSDMTFVNLNPERRRLYEREMWAVERLMDRNNVHVKKLNLDEKRNERNTCEI